MNQHNEQHSIILLVSSKSGVLIHIALVFPRRGYNLDSLVVYPKLNVFQAMLEQYGIQESVRSGKLIMARGTREI